MISIIKQIVKHYLTWFFEGSDELIYDRYKGNMI